MIESDPKICLDSNLWVKLFVQEEKSAGVRGLFGEWLDQGRIFVAPSFLIFEFSSALRKKEKMNLLKKEDGVRALKLFYDYPILLYQSEEFLEIAWTLAQRMEETVLYDAGYLALAIWQKVPFYTADEKFFKRAEKFYAESYLV